MHTKLACNWEVVKQKRTRLQGSTSLASVSSNSRVCWFADATGVEFHFIPGDRYTLDKLTVYFYPTTSINRVGRCQNSKRNGTEKVKVRCQMSNKWKFEVNCKTNMRVTSMNWAPLIGTRKEMFLALTGFSELLQKYFCGIVLKRMCFRKYLCLSDFAAGKLKLLKGVKFRLCDQHHQSFI